MLSDLSSRTGLRANYTSIGKLSDRAVFTPRLPPETDVHFWVMTSARPDQVDEIIRSGPTGEPNSVRASESIAEAYFLRGQIHDAVMQLSRLSEKSDLTYYQRARITARLDEMQETLGELGEEPQQG